MVDQEDNGMDYKTPEETKVEVTAPSALKQTYVVSVVFNADPEAQKRYQAHYSTSRPNRDRKYNYLTTHAFKAGDYAVVETPCGGLTVVTVVEDAQALLTPDLPGHKWVIDAVDYEGYKARKEREKRAAFLLQSLSNRAKELTARLKLEEVLASDPQSQEMLAELKSLS